MTRREIKELLKDPEFVPFTIVMTNGDRIEVPHPDFVVVTAQSTLHVYEPDPEDPSFASYRFKVLATHNISSLEPASRRTSA